MDITLVVPVHGAYDYLVRTLHSFFVQTTPLPGRGDLALHAVVVNDDSPATLPEIEAVLAALGLDRARIMVVGHRTSVGYIAAANAGMEHALINERRRSRASQSSYMLFGPARDSYIVLGNSDILFTPRWHEPLCCALDSGYHLVAPVTNTPGDQPLQFVGNYTPAYVKSDDPQVLARVAAALLVNGRQPVEGKLNGFFLMARAADWDDYRFDDDHVFRPRNEFNSKGLRNPTPTMTLSEYELQARWRAHGRRIGFDPRSYVFHYRAASRGAAFRRGDWMEITNYPVPEKGLTPASTAPPTGVIDALAVAHEIDPRAPEKAFTPPSNMSEALDFCDRVFGFKKPDEVDPRR